LTAVNGRAGSAAGRARSRAPVRVPIAAGAFVVRALGLRIGVLLVDRAEDPRVEVIGTGSAVLRGAAGGARLGEPSHPRTTVKPETRLIENLPRLTATLSGLMVYEICFRVNSYMKTRFTVVLGRPA